MEGGGSDDVTRMGISGDGTAAGRSDGGTEMGRSGCGTRMGGSGKRTASCGLDVGTGMGRSDGTGTGGSDGVSETGQSDGDAGVSGSVGMGVETRGSPVQLQLEDSTGQSISVQLPGMKVPRHPPHPFHYTTRLGGGKLIGPCGML